MTRDHFKTLALELTRRRHALMFETKNKEYAVDADALANFKQRAKLQHEEPWEVCFSDMTKHLVQIQDHLRGTNRTKSESLESRFHDALNYFDLLWGLVIEAEGPGACKEENAPIHASATGWAESERRHHP